MTSPAALTVTMTPSGVVFSGAANVYRYDRPSPPEVAAYIRSTLGPDPAGAVVHVVGREDDVEKLDQALAGYDVVITAERPAEQTASPSAVVGDAETETLLIPRPEPGGRPGYAGMYIGAAVVAAAVLAGAAIWATAARDPGDAQAVPQPEVSPTSEEAEAASPATPATPAPKSPTVVVQRQGLGVELPAGFTVAPDGDMWRGTGADPDLRIQLAVDNLYDLPPEHMTQQVLRDIEADPEVTLVSNDGSTVMYRQISPDGSETLWKTWADGGHQLFVGCHTRTAATTVQQATCAMAMDSAVFDAEAAATAG